MVNVLLTSAVVSQSHDLHIPGSGKETDAGSQPQQGEKDRRHDDGIVVGQVGDDRSAPIGGGHQHSNRPDAGEQEQSTANDGDHGLRSGCDRQRRSSDGHEP